MIFLTLFLTFLKVGAFTFGGGYAMIAIVKEEVLAHGWMSEQSFLDLIAVSESTPGPIAINMATFIGSSQGGFLGALVCTLGVVLPSFIIILLIVAILNNLLKYAGVNAFLGGIRPCVAGLIVGTGLTMILSVLFGVETVRERTGIEWKSVAIFAIVALVAFLYKKLRKKKISPILLIAFSAVLGILFFSF